MAGRDHSTPKSFSHWLVILNEVKQPGCGRGALTPRVMADEGVRPTSGFFSRHSGIRMTGYAYLLVY